MSYRGDVYYEDDLDEQEDEENEIDVLNSKLEDLKAKLVEKEREVSDLKSALKVHTELGPSGPHKGPLVFLNHSKIPGLRFVSTIGDRPFAAIFEDIPTEGPNWMVVHRRFDGSVDFGALQDHRNPFGDLNGEFFLGLKILHSATSRCRHELYIELDDFHDVRAFAKYDHFEVGSENEHFRLKSLGAYTGNAGDALHSHLNHKYVSIDVIKDGDLKVFEWWSSDGYMW